MSVTTKPKVEIHACYTCGHEWEHGRSGTHSCSSRLVVQRDEARSELIASQARELALREAAESAQTTLQKLGDITDETRIGWSLQALDAALSSPPPPVVALAEHERVIQTCLKTSGAALRVLGALGCDANTTAERAVENIQALTAGRDAAEKDAADLLAVISCPCMSGTSFGLCKTCAQTLAAHEARVKGGKP